MIKLLVAFLVGIAADVVWVWWHRAVAAKAPEAAATATVGIIVCGAVCTYAVAMRDWSTFASYCAGAWVGTYYATLWGDREQS